MSATPKPTYEVQVVTSPTEGVNYRVTDTMDSKQVALVKIVRLLP